MGRRVSWSVSCAPGICSALLVNVWLLSLIWLGDGRQRILLLYPRSQDCRFLQMSDRIKTSSTGDYWGQPSFLRAYLTDNLRQSDDAALVGECNPNEYFP